MHQRAPQGDIQVILNPHAAKDHAFKRKDDILACFRSAGVPCGIGMTDGPLHASELAYQAVADGKRMIVAAGGDGTLNEVVDGVYRASADLGLDMANRPAVGLLPVGRGNDFAYIAKIPKDLCKACSLIIAGQWLATDCARVFIDGSERGRCFINGVGIGFEPLVNFAASDFKHVTGMASYLLGLVKVMLRYPEAVEACMELDCGSIACRTQQISVCNGRRMGSMFLMGPQALIDDGLLDVVYANRPIGGAAILGKALKFLNGSQLKDSAFSMERTRSFSLTAQSPMACHADGEEISRACRSIRVELHPGALKFIRNPWNYLTNE